MQCKSPIFMTDLKKYGHFSSVMYPNRRKVNSILHAFAPWIRFTIWNGNLAMWIEFWAKKKQLTNELIKHMRGILLTIWVIKAADFNYYHLSLYCVYVVFCERPSLRRPDVNTFLLLRQGIFTSVVFGFIIFDYYCN